MLLVQSNQVKSSYHMEKEGLRLATDRLKEENVPIHELVTDRHMQNPEVD